MRRSIDDDQLAVPPGLEGDESPLNWAVSIVDDYDDAVPRVQLLIEETGAAGRGMLAHMDAASARRLRLSLATALAQIGEDAGR